MAEADQIVNVDITTEDLRRRLEEGKVYTTERVETALTHSFAASNLEQLRDSRYGNLPRRSIPGGAHHKRTPAPPAPIR